MADETERSERLAARSMIDNIGLERKERVEPVSSHRGCSLWCAPSCAKSLGSANERAELLRLGPQYTHAYTARSWWLVKVAKLGRLLT